MSADAELLTRATAGDHDAFAALVARYQCLVVGVAFAITRDRAIAEDIGQETFVAAWRGLASLEDRARAAPWLAGIARNLAHNSLRKQRRRQAIVITCELEAICTPEEELARVEVHTALRRVLGELTAEQREALVLYYFEERSVGDVAAKLGVTDEVMKQRLHRARAATRDRLTPQLELGLEAMRPRGGFASSVIAAIATFPVTDAGAATTPIAIKATGETLMTVTKLAIAVTTIAGVGAVTAISLYSNASNADSAQLEMAHPTRERATHAGFVEPAGPQGPSARKISPVRGISATDHLRGFDQRPAPARSDAAGRSGDDSARMPGTLEDELNKLGSTLDECFGPGAKPNGVVGLSLRLGRDPDGAVTVDAVEVDEERSTVRDPAILECFQQTMFTIDLDPVAYDGIHILQVELHQAKNKPTNPL